MMTVTEKLNLLPRLTNAQLAEAESRQHSIPLDECPACGATKELQEGGFFEFVPGPCESKGYPSCETQMLLRKHYLLANIPDQYQRLSWDFFIGPEEVSDWVSAYLDCWDAHKRNGMGLEIYTDSVGVGKTFTATHIAKELVKRGERVFHVSFGDVIAAFARPDAHEFEERLRNVTLLSLDEVIAPTTEAQGNLFRSRFETLIRYRTDFNLPTIITTNLLGDELQENYPRPYSLLRAKQIDVKIDFDEDARQGFVRENNLANVRVDSSFPVT
jgi:DNA replication protein DnaC